MSQFTIDDLAEITETGREHKKYGTEKTAEMLITRRIILPFSYVNLGMRTVSPSIVYEGCLPGGIEVRTTKFCHSNSMDEETPDLQSGTILRELAERYPVEGDIARVRWYSHGLLPDPWRRTMYVDIAQYVEPVVIDRNPKVEFRRAADKKA